MTQKYRGVLGGTSFGEPLCRTCRSAQFIQGRSLSSSILRCHNFNRDLQFEAMECSAYDDKRIPSLWDMEQLAWVFKTDVKTRQIGFKSPEEIRAEKQGHEAQPATESARS
jgi:hypothetical protein